MDERRRVAVAPAALIRIEEGPLSIDEVLALVGAAGVGGSTVFVGTVRDSDEGRDVRELEYTAHPTALHELQRLAGEVAARYPALTLAAVHRTGRLSVGDVAVIVAVGAAHRGDSFTAARELIDRLKAEVPIWKHQIFADGTEEWVGTP